MTTTLPTEADASRLAALVVEERLAACAQVQGPIASLFYWEGRLDRATEWYLHCKTTRTVLERLITRIRNLHPYDTPEIVAVPIIGGDAAYLRWVTESVVPD